MAQSFIKDPDAVLDYQIDWSDLLGDDTITSSEWVASDGITIDSNSFADTAATVWLSGGTVGQDYAVTNHITTDGGREDDRTITIMVRQK